MLYVEVCIMWDPMWDLIKNIFWIYVFICNRYYIVWQMWEKKEGIVQCLIRRSLEELSETFAQISKGNQWACDTWKAL